MEFDDAKFEPSEVRFVRRMPHTACSNASEHYRVKLSVAGALANCQGYWLAQTVEQANLILKFQFISKKLCQVSRT